MIMPRIVNKMIRGNLEYVWVENVSEMTKLDISKRYGVSVTEVKKITRDTATFTRPITHQLKTAQKKPVAVKRYKTKRSVVRQHKRTKPKRR